MARGAARGWEGAGDATAAQGNEHMRVPRDRGKGGCERELQGCKGQRSPLPDAPRPAHTWSITAWPRRWAPSGLKLGAKKSSLQASTCMMSRGYRRSQGSEGMRSAGWMHAGAGGSASGRAGGWGWGGVGWVGGWVGVSPGLDHAQHAVNHGADGPGCGAVRRRVLQPGRQAGR